MTLKKLLSQGKLKPHKTSKEELINEAEKFSKVTAQWAKEKFK
jgi:hypothetical protein